ncbi:MAG: hypothetical protein OEV00_01055 [Acidobacteriota bacterium]|nr:hypothetical protein [Acidobacteriota bacterium]
MRISKSILVIVLVALTLPLLAATAPDRLNYQGVLRDSFDNPINATYDVVFRLYPFVAGGSDYIVDQHLIAGTGGVTFQNGLFNAQIGGGNVFDGSGPATYNSLAEVFEFWTDVWLEIEVNGEILSPRVPIASSAHALNAEHAETADSATDAMTVGGLSTSSLLTTSGSTQTKAGSLTIDGTLTAGGNIFDFGSSARIHSTTDYLHLQAGDQTSDDLYLQAGSGPGQGRIVVQGLGPMNFSSGDGTYSFDDANGMEIASMTPLGYLQIDGGFDFDGSLTSAAGGYIFPAASIFRVQAGDNDTDDLWLVAGNDNTDGRIILSGDAQIDFLSGNGRYNFWNESLGMVTADLDPTGNLNIDGSLTFDGTLTSALGGYVTAGQTIMRVQAGDTDSDDLWLVAGNDNTDGRIIMNGDGPIEIRAGNGSFQFYNESTGQETASLDASGNLQIEGSLSTAGGASLTSFATSTSLQAGDLATDDLYLRAGSTSSNGEITIFGEGEMWFDAGNGTYRFYNGSNVETASLNSVGDIQMDGDLLISGNDLDFGGGAQFSTSTASMFAYGGTTSTDDLHLYASTAGLTSGSISIFGSSTIQINSGNGTTQFLHQGNLKGFIDSAGRLDLDGNLDLDGGNIYMRESGIDGNQDIHFREDGLNSGERFEWDNAADRFEVSDDFHTFGTLTATTKNFVQNHPYRDDLEIVYTSLEGDEVTAFTRGFGRLKDGVARVQLGETFPFVANPDLGLSAHLTPRGQWADLFVEELSVNEIVVRAAPGTPDVAFDFIVFGLRIGHEQLPVMRPKRSESFLPTEEQYVRDRGNDPALGEATALARYSKMAADAHGRASIDTSRGDALKLAIGQRDTQFDYPVGSDRSERARHAELKSEIDPDAYAQVEEETRPDAIEATRRSVGGEVTTAAVQVAPPIRDGDLYADSFRSGAGEMATMLPTGQSLDAGDVVSIDSQTGAMIRATLNADRAVFGVVAADAGMLLGARETEGENSKTPIAMSGIVLCNVDASYGAILPGDLLVTSETAGHARRDDDPATGTVLGKALDRLEVGTGQIRVLVTLR